MFNCVDWFSYYSRSNFQPATLKLRCSFLHAQLTCIWHTDSSTICFLLPLVVFLSKSQMTSSLKLKHVVITSHNFVLSFKHHSTDLITLEFWPTVPPSTLLTTFTYNDTHNILLPLLASTKATKFPTELFQFQFKTINWLHCHIVLASYPHFFPLTRNHHSTKPQNHNFHWLQISSLFCTKQLCDTPDTKIARFDFFSTSLRNSLVLVE